MIDRFLTFLPFIVSKETNLQTSLLDSSSLLGSRIVAVSSTSWMIDTMMPHRSFCVRILFRGQVIILNVIVIAVPLLREGKMDVSDG